MSEQPTTLTSPPVMTLDHSLDQLEDRVAREIREDWENGGLLLQVARLVSDAKSKYFEGWRKNRGALDKAKWQNISKNSAAQERRLKRETRLKWVKKASDGPFHTFKDTMEKLDKEHFGLASVFEEAVHGDPESIWQILLAFPDLLTLETSDYKYTYFSAIIETINDLKQQVLEARLKGGKEQREETETTLKIIMGGSDRKTIMVPGYVLLPCYYQFRNLHKSIKEGGAWDELAIKLDEWESCEKIIALGLEAEKRSEQGVYGGADKPAGIAAFLTAKAFSDYGVTERYVKKMVKTPWKNHLKTE